MKYASIRNMDISNGLGCGVALFVQGCHFHCKNCFNPSTWDFEGGKEFTAEIEGKFLSLADHPFIRRVSFLGGEPLAPENREKVAELCKKLFGTKKVWLYTGYAYEDIPKDILQYIDVLVDGRYIDDLKDFSLKFKGSANQRVIDVQQSLKKDQVILLEV